MRCADFLLAGMVCPFGHEALDGATISNCRRGVNTIKQQAGLAINQSGAGSAGLAAKIREECRKVLRNPHPLEHF